MTQVAQATTTDNTAIRTFPQLHVPDSELADLRRRINAARWPSRELVHDDTQGVQLATMQALARYWGTDYDWRRCEAQLNAIPQFITEIDGQDIHFMHIRSKHDNALPLIVTHGWPGSVIEQTKIIGPLTDPTAHGASASDAFHLVIPSMPGLRVFPRAGDPRVGSGADRQSVDRVDGTPRVRAIRRAGRRLGGERHAVDGVASARASARNSLEHAGHRSGRDLGGGDVRCSGPRRPFGRRTACVRAVGDFYGKHLGYAIEMEIARKRSTG